MSKTGNLQLYNDIIFQCNNFFYIGYRFNFLYNLFTDFHFHSYKVCIRVEIQFITAIKWDRAARYKFHNTSY